jgi:hypothetical protein
MRTEDEQQLLASGDYWIQAVDTWVDGWYAAIDEEDGYPNFIYATEKEARSDLPLSVLGQIGPDDDFFVVHASAYKHFRKTLASPSGVCMTGERLPILRDNPNDPL